MTDPSQYYVAKTGPNAGTTYTSFDVYKQYNANNLDPINSTSQFGQPGGNPPAPTSTGAPVGTGSQPPNPNPVTTPGSTSQFSSYVKSDTSPTVYGQDANGNYTAFSNEKDFLTSGGNFANVKTVTGFNPGTTQIYGKNTSSTSNPSAPAGQGDIPLTSSGAPDYYKLYQQQLQKFGIGTGDPNTDPNQQLLTVNQQIVQDQKVLAPLSMSHTQFPDSLQPLQEGGATQSQLDLKAAQAAAPIQTAMSFLIQDRSALGTFITNAQTFATNAVQQAQTTYDTQLKLQQYDFKQIGTHVNELGQTVPDYGYVNGFTGKILPATQPNSNDITQPTYNLNGFPITIGTRPSASNPKITEYYNTQTGQGFGNAQQLADFVNKQTNSNTATATNVFGLLNGAQNKVDQISGATANTRTDRNNNPVAASVAVKPDGSANMADPTTSEWLTTLDKAGIGYTIEQGNNFSGNRATIKFDTPQDGIAGAKVLLGTSAFYWYKNNTGKSELASVASPDAFKKLSDSQKTTIVKGIYSHEQPGGQLFNTSSSVANTNQTIQNQVAALPPLLQGYVHNSPTGYGYTAPSASDEFRNAISAKAPDVIPLSTEQSSNEDGLVKAMGFVSQAQDLINKIKLPTNPYDTARLGNTWDAALKNDPQLAQLGQLWQGAIQVLQGLGTTGIRSTALIENSASTDFPTASSIDGVARAQLSNLLTILQSEEKTIMGGRVPPVDYQSQANNLLQGSVTNGSDSTYDSLNQIFGNLSVGTANTSNINILP